MFCKIPTRSWLELGTQGLPPGWSLERPPLQRFAASGCHRSSQQRLLAVQSCAEPPGLYVCWRPADFRIHRLEHEHKAPERPSCSAGAVTALGDDSWRVTP